MCGSQQPASLRRKIEIGAARPYGRHDIGFRFAALDHVDDVAIGKRRLPSLWQAGRRPGRPLLAARQSARHDNRQNQRFKVPAHHVFLSQS